MKVVNTPVCKMKNARFVTIGVVLTIFTVFNLFSFMPDNISGDKI